MFDFKKSVKGIYSELFVYVCASPRAHDVQVHVRARTEDLAVFWRLSRGFRGGFSASPGAGCCVVGHFRHPPPSATSCSTAASL